MRKPPHPATAVPYCKHANRGYGGHRQGTCGGCRDKGSIARCYGETHSAFWRLRLFDEEHKD